MRLKKVIAMGLAIIMTASIAMTGCSSNGDKSAGGKAKLTVFVYMQDHEKAVYKKMIDEFKEANKDTVKDVDFQVTTQDEYATTLTGMMASGDMPDVFYVGPESVVDYVKNGYVASLDQMLKDNNISTDDMYQNVLNVYKYDGTTTGSGSLYALPKDGSTFAYAYNKDLFDEAGVEYPNPDKPYTYDEFVKVCQALTKDKDGDGETDQWGAGFADGFMLHQFIWSNGASFLSDDYKTVTVNTPEFIDAVQKYVDLTLKYKVTPTVEQDSSLGVYQRWLAGQEAFYACGTWDVGAFMDKETFPYNWDLCAYPTLSTGVSTTWNGTVGFCISDKSKNKEAALKLISYLTTNLEGQKELSGATGGESIQLPNIQSYAQKDFISAVKDGTVKYPSNINVFFNYLNGTDTYKGKMMETTYTPNSEWSSLFFEGFPNVKNGSVSVADYLAEVQPKMQESLDKAWANVK
ncbi:multiple sugar transport system substrate-binding protein [Anaerocolumna jejuensis DSM 15929]|uniref:Multiple sugar transport system substrate-binding protein n=1 Tax=Anaerocolumna jejuensis DSM 15929 TaxID=1121322 RepID=A0A1M6R3S4_9FIRM|nr:sugar ABC transporter substrate-binding protein [Anaerocolumna jejuensis]SHK27066.1 multiple sugar transport system substrate-binding protein [Anaerocolumna jejuensis DSM 15929]